MARKKATPAEQPWQADQAPAEEGAATETPATEESNETAQEETQTEQPKAPETAAITAAPAKKGGSTPLKEGDHVPNEVMHIMTTKGMTLKQAIAEYNSKQK